MTEMEKKVNDLIMQEIGLEVGEGNKIYDQDTGMALRINGADVVAPGFYNGRQTVEFDPFNNRKMIGSLFTYFTEKRSEETGVDIVAFYNVDSKFGNKGSIECSLSDNTKITSGKYVRDSLKYADVIIQLNGGDASSLSEYDTPIEKSAVKKSSRGGTKNGRSSKN